MKLKKHLVGLTLFAAFSAAGCGGSDGGNALDDAVTAALKVSATADDAGFTVDDAMIGCVADAVLGNDTSREKLQAAFDEGLEGEKLLDAVGDTESDLEMTKLMMGCFSSEQLVDLMIGDMVQDGEPTDEEKQCLVDEFDKIDKDELTDGLFSLGNDQTDSPGATKITAASVTCLGLDAFG
jgi:hypothetical protein